MEVGTTNHNMLCISDNCDC